MSSKQSLEAAVTGESESYKAKCQSAAPASCRLLYDKKHTKRNSENGCGIFLVTLFFLLFLLFFLIFFL